MSSFENVHKIKCPVCDIKRWIESKCTEVPRAKILLELNESADGIFAEYMSPSQRDASFCVEVFLLSHHHNPLSVDAWFSVRLGGSIRALAV